MKIYSNRIINTCIKLSLSAIFIFNFNSCRLEDIDDSNEKDAEIAGVIDEEITDEEISDEEVTDDEIITKDKPDEETSTPTEAENLLILVNASRAEEGLNPLVLNDALNKAAFSHSDDMNTNNYFSHQGQNDSQFWERTEAAGYTGSSIGENIAKGQSTVEAVHNSWMTSDGHRANILSPNITEMGLGHSGSYWTQIFGRSR